MLFISSLVFYGWGEPVYVVLMLLSISVNYGLGLLIEKYQDTKYAKVWLTVSVVFSLGLLGYFKYTDFFIANFNLATGLSYPLLNIALPIGISFYTFQIMSYSIDVYRKETGAQKNFINLAAYITMFPQLIAGPIVRYADMAMAIDEREHTFELVRSGLVRFILGLAKKVILANTLGELGEIFKGMQGASVLFHWLYALSFPLQIYFDFSGYSDMAIGLGRIMGFRFKENFNYPFISKSITEFWRRWHISLGTWFRDYLYIPLGGNRVKRSRWLLNILLVWMLTGFWHGAAWNFILWGLLFAFMLIVEKLWIQKLLSRLPGIAKHIYVLLVVIVSFVIFDAPDISIASTRILTMFGAGNTVLTDSPSLYYLGSYGLIFILAIIGSTPLPGLCFAQIGKSSRGKKLLTFLEPIILLGLLVVITAYLVDSSFNPFLYFRF